jgi:hypothetical protein
MRADEAASTTVQIVRADRDFFGALEKTHTNSSEQLRQALMEFYVQPHYEFFQQWNRNNKGRDVEVWVDKLVDHIHRYPTVLEQIRSQYPAGEIETLITPSLQRARMLAGVDEMAPVYSFVGAFEDNAFAVPSLPAMGICLEWFLSVDFLMTLDLPDSVKQFVTLNEGLVPTFLAHEFAHTVQKLSLFGAESLAVVVLGEGMAVLFSEFVCPGQPLEKYLCFSQDQLMWCRKHETQLWLRFQKDIASEGWDDQNVKSYLSPFGLPLLRDTPPRVGYFIGYQICRSYLAATGEDVKSLLSISSAAHIIEGSRHNP